MHISQSFINFALLSCTVWMCLSLAYPNRHRRSRKHDRSNFRADDIKFENMHISENEIDPNHRHLVPDGNDKEEAAEVSVSSFKVLDFDEADFNSSFVQPSSEHFFNRSHHDSHVEVHVASWRWEYVRTPFIYTAVVIVAGFCKIGFHHAEFLSSILPESCMLIVLGIIVGTIVHFTHSRELLPQFTPKAFFLFLLPPIVLESAYSLHDRAFFNNLGTIILYAVIGTILNCFVIGLSLYGLTYLGALGDIHFHLIECLVFSALISAVDPVAVLAIFQEVGVNKCLYFLVFGESLLNDAVTIVLYMTMVVFSKAEYVTAEQVLLGITAFICVSLGSLSIGIFMGIFTALITKYTEEVRVVEPLAMLGVAYLSYLMAEMVHFSGIISIIACGIVQAHYAAKNISSKSNTTVKYFTKMLSAVCDTIIFLFLGMVLVDDQHIWQTGFVLWSTGLCLVVRFGSVFFLTFCANKFERTHRINEEEQFIMAYGGLRGAVAFSLVIMLEDIEHKNLFITTTLFIILFTVFIQGATIKPLVDYLKIRRQATKDTRMFTEVNKKLLDHVMAGVEEVTGDHGGNHWKQLFLLYNKKYFKKWLMCSNTESNLTRIYTRMMLEDHFTHLYGPAAVIEDQKPLLLNTVGDDESDDVLEVFPSAMKMEEDAGDQELETQEKHSKEDLDRIRKPSFKFDLQDSEETKPLKGKKKRNSDSSALPKRPPLLKRQTTLAMFNKTQDDDPSRLLQKALLHNPYYKLHQKYNPNLVDDEDQDINAQLKKRRLRARRLALLAMHKSNAGTPERRESVTTEQEAVITNPLVPLAASFFLERAEKRRMLKKETSSKPEETEAANNKPVKLERQCAVSKMRTLNGISTIGEENETEVIVSGESSSNSQKDEHKESEV